MCRFFNAVRVFSRDREAVGGIKPVVSGANPGNESRCGALRDGQHRVGPSRDREAVGGIKPGVSEANSGNESKK